MSAALLWLVESTPGRIILGVVAFLFWLTVHDARVTSRAETKVIAEQQQKALAEIDRQRKGLQEASDEADKQASVDDQKIASLTQQLEKTRADLAASAKAPCHIPAAATRGLSVIK